MFAGPLPRELKPPGGRVPARRPRGRASPRASLNPERRVPARAPQAPACPRTRALFAADAPRLAAPLSSLCRPARCDVPLAAPSCSLRCSPRCTVLLATPSCSPPIRRTARRPARYRGAFAHPTRWRSISARSEPAQHAITPQQWSRCAKTPQQCNGTQKRRSNGANAQKRRSNVTTGRPPMHMSRWRNGRHKNCALTWAVRSPLDSRQVFSASPLLPCTRRTEETWAQNATSR